MSAAKPYRIVRNYFRHASRTLKYVATEAEARRHCEDPETSSETCKKPHNKLRTRRMGPWFDGWTLDGKPSPVSGEDALSLSLIGLLGR